MVKDVPDDLSSAMDGQMVTVGKDFPGIDLSLGQKSHLAWISSYLNGPATIDRHSEKHLGGL
jgi:hypothetical protein